MAPEPFGNEVRMDPINSHPSFTSSSIEDGTLRGKATFEDGTLRGRTTVEEGSKDSSTKLTRRSTINKLFQPEEIHQNNQTVQRISLIFALVYITCVISFSVTYATSSFVSCSQNLVEIPEFREDAIACVCENAVGNNQIIFSEIVMNSSYAKTNNLLGGLSILTPLPLTLCSINQIFNSTKGKFLVQDVNYAGFCSLVYGTLFSTNLVNYTFNVFQEPGVVLPSETFSRWKKTSFPSSNFTCSIQDYNNGTTSTFYSSEDCVSHIREVYNPDFTTEIHFDYIRSKAYAHYCNLQFCKIRQCGSFQSFSILLFVLSTNTAIYLILRLIFRGIFLCKTFDGEIIVGK